VQLTPFICSSRGPNANEANLLKALEDKKVIGAGPAVYGFEPLPLAHRFGRHYS
jgi:phosphoglycerate dehydrogenase-like enzyme